MWNWRKRVRDLSNCLCWRNLGDLSYLPHSHRVWSLPTPSASWSSGFSRPFSPLSIQVYRDEEKGVWMRRQQAWGTGMAEDRPRNLTCPRQLITLLSCSCLR